VHKNRNTFIKSRQTPINHGQPLEIAINQGKPRDQYIEMCIKIQKIPKNQDKINMKNNQEANM